MITDKNLIINYLVNWFKSRWDHKQSKSLSSIRASPSFNEGFFLTIKFKYKLIKFLALIWHKLKLGVKFIDQSVEFKYISL